MKRYKQYTKTFVTLATLGLIMVAVFVIPVGHASAGPSPDPGANVCADGSTSSSVSGMCNTPKCAKPTFFGLIPWYQYLKLDDKCNIGSFQILPSGNGKSEVKSDIPLVLLAIIDDLLRIAGIAAVGYIIYGAIQYIISQGSPDGTARAQSTILNALIGLTIALISVVGVDYLGTVLGG